jgi:hypothetical protein
MHRLLLAVALAGLAGCSATAPPTPEEIAARGVEGRSYVARGTVFTITFDNLPKGPDDFELAPERYILIRTKVPRGVAMPDLDPASDWWGLALRVSPDAGLRLPQIGDRVRASGVLTRRMWAGEMKPMLNLIDLTVESGAAPLGEANDGCSFDGDCRDELICDRATQRCAKTPGAIDWNSAWHDVNGTCDTDGDCPAGQQCDLAYSIPSTGTFAPGQHAGDAGRHLCVVQPGVDPCAHPVPVADLVGGRFTQGREVCVTGDIFVTLVANDGDTHVQLAVPEPFPYPAATAHYEVFGAVTENSPPYKDPARPGGGLADPQVRQHVRALGTYRYDVGHGWFELHPVKMYWIP